MVTSVINTISYKAIKNMTFRNSLYSRGHYIAITLDGNQA